MSEVAHDKTGSVQTPLDPPRETIANLGPDALVLVTGGSGFFGGRMARHLLERGVRVRVADIRPPTDQMLARAEHVVTDLTDRSQATAACAGVSHVLHFAGNPSGTRSITEPVWDFETNAVASTNVFQAALDQDVHRMVYVSSGMVYGAPQSCPIPESHAVAPFIPYAASKLSAEFSARAASKTYGLDVSVARPFTLYGPGEDPATSGGEVSQYLRWHLNELPIPVTGDPDQKSRDFTHVDDAVRAVLTVLAHGATGETYNVGTGAETTLTALLETIGEVTGSVPQTRIDLATTDDTYRHVADISRLRALGYRPSIDLHEGINSLVGTLGDRPVLPTLPTLLSLDRTSRRAS